MVEVKVQGEGEQAGHQDEPQLKDHHRLRYAGQPFLWVYFSL